MRRLLAAIVTLGGAVAVLGLVVTLVATVPRPIGATAPPLQCPSTSNAFLSHVCQLAGTTAAWQTMTVSKIGPTPEMYAKLAKAVAAMDTSVCSDAQVMQFMAAGWQMKPDAAVTAKCLAYLQKVTAQGWFEITDSATGDTMRIEISK